MIDQYQVSEDKQSGIKSDPNREDDEQYIVRLIGQVLRVSMETVLPFFAHHVLVVVVMFASDG